MRRPAEGKRAKKLAGGGRKPAKRMRTKTPADLAKAAAETPAAHLAAPASPTSAPPAPIKPEPAPPMPDGTTTKQVLYRRATISLRDGSHQKCWRVFFPQQSFPGTPANEREYFRQFGTKMHPATPEKWMPL